MSRFLAFLLSCSVTRRDLHNDWHRSYKIMFLCLSETWICHEIEKGESWLTGFNLRFPWNSSWSEWLDMSVQCQQDHQVSVSRDYRGNEKLENKCEGSKYFPPGSRPDLSTLFNSLTVDRPLKIVNWKDHSLLKSINKPAGDYSVRLRIFKLSAHC